MKSQSTAADARADVVRPSAPRGNWSPALLSAVPSHEELVARAAEIRPILWEEASASDGQRRLTDRTVSALAGAGLMRLFTPRRFGGHEAGPSTMLEVCIELARGCCSASWVTSVLNVGNYMAALFPAQAQEDVWGSNPDARTALVIVASRASVERVDGGVVVSGDWSYASGSLHCDWVGALIPKGPDSDEQVTHLVLMPAGDVTVQDTWHVTGMRGTGSNTVVADRVFIPRHRVTPYSPIVRGQHAGPGGTANLYRSSLSGLLSAGLLGPHIGAVEAAFQYVREHAPGRRVASSTFASQVQSPAFQMDLAEVSMLVDGARLHAQRIARTVDEHARAGTTPDEVTRSRARMEGTQVTRSCREAIDRLISAYGSSAFAESNPLQRIWRDIHVASRHAGFGMGIPQLVYGRALVGLDPREISYLV